MKVLNVFYFLIGLLSFFLTRVFGIISFGEILIILYVAWLALSGRISFGKSIIDDKLRKVLIFLGLAITSALISSLLNGSSDIEIVKYVGTIILLPFSFFFFRDMLINDQHGIVPFTLGYGLSNIIVNLFFVQFSDYVVGQRGDDFQQFQDDFYAYTICYLAYVVNAYYYCRNIKLLFLLNLILALLCLMGNSRHLCLMLVIHDFFLYLIYYVDKNNISVSVGKIASWGCMLALVLLMTYKGYGYMAKSGALGEYGKWKYEVQEKKKGGIASSRSWSMRGIIALSHHPLGGLKDSGKEVADNEEIRREYAQFMNISISSNKSLMGHSTILDWWIVYGIFTVPFWIYIIKLTVMALKGMLSDASNSLLAVTLYSCLNMLWDIFFSPFGGRIGYGLSIMLVIYSISLTKMNKDQGNEV